MVFDTHNGIYKHGVFCQFAYWAASAAQTFLFVRTNIPYFNVIIQIDVTINKIMNKRETRSVIQSRRNENERVFAK